MESPVHLKEVKYHLDELVKLIQSQQDWISARPKAVPMDEVFLVFGQTQSGVEALIGLNREVLFHCGIVIDQMPTETGEVIKRLLDEQYRVAMSIHADLADAPKTFLRRVLPV
jgi:hypothetical protein